MSVVVTVRKDTGPRVVALNNLKEQLEAAGYGGEFEASELVFNPEQGLLEWSYSVTICGKRFVGRHP